MKWTSAIIVLLALLGCASNPADNKPTATVKTPAATATAAKVEGKKFMLAEGSKVEFTGSKVTGSHSGGFEKVMGSVTVPEAGVEGAQIAIEMDMTTTYSDSEKLTGHLKSEDFFDVEKFPKSTFDSTKIMKNEDGSYAVTGNLTFHGVTKEITFPAAIDASDEMVTAKAEFSINRNDFGVKYPGKPDDLIREEVVIKFDVTAKAG